MYNDIDTEERIDNYLLGRMSDGERRAFEEELEKDADLKAEYEWQRLIADAVQRVAMREVLNKLAADYKAKETEQSPKGIINFGTIRDFFRSKQNVASLVSVAAAIVIIIGSVVNFTISSKMDISATQLLAQSEPELSRGGSEIEAQIKKIYDLIGENELDSAFVSIEDAQRMINKEDSFEMGTESRDGYSDDIKWYKTIILMKQGKVSKARKELKAIAANPENPYSDYAKNWKKYSKQ